MSAHYAKKDQNEISTRKKKIKNSEINRKGKRHPSIENEFKFCISTAKVKTFHNEI